MQQVAQRLHFGRKALNFPFGGFQRLARGGFGGFGIVAPGAGDGGGGARGFRGGPGAFGLRFRGMDVRRILGRFQGTVQTCLGVSQLGLAGFHQGRRQIAAPLKTGFAGITIGQFGRQLFKKSLCVRQGLGEFGGQDLGRAHILAGAGIGCSQFFRLSRQPRQSRLGILLQRLLADRVGLALGKQLAHALRGFAGACFLGVQLLALGDQSMMGGCLFRFCLPQRRQDCGRLGLGGRSLGGDFCRVGHIGGSDGQFLGRADSLGLSGDPAQMMRQRLGLADMPGQISIARGLAGLALQAGKLAFDFADDVFQARQVGFRGAQAQFGLVAALMQAANAGGFLQDGAARQGLLADQKANLALAHEGGRARAGRGVGKEYLHVALAHVAAVDAIDAAGLALDAARHFDRIEIDVGAAGGAVGIVDEQRDLGHVAGRPAGAAREDHIVHLAAADGRGPGFAHHPAHRIEQVGLAAAVRADHGGQTRFYEQLRRFDEGFETGKPEPGELQRTCAAFALLTRLFLFGERLVQEFRHGLERNVARALGYAVQNKGRRAGDVVFGLAIRRDLVDAFILSFVGDALVDLLRGHAGDPAQPHKSSMNIGHPIFNVPLRLIPEQQVNEVEVLILRQTAGDLFRCTVVRAQGEDPKHIEDLARVDVLRFQPAKGLGAECRANRATGRGIFDQDHLGIPVPQRAVGRINLVALGGSRRTRIRRRAGQGIPGNGTQHGQNDHAQDQQGFARHG